MSGPGLDPVLTEVLRNAFASIAEQMNRTLIPPPTVPSFTRCTTAV